MEKESITFLKNIIYSEKSTTEEKKIAIDKIKDIDKMLSEIKRKQIEGAILFIKVYYASIVIVSIVVILLILIYKK